MGLNPERASHYFLLSFYFIALLKLMMNLPKLVLLFFTIVMLVKIGL